MKYQIRIRHGSNLIHGVVLDSEQTQYFQVLGITLAIADVGVFTGDERASCKIDGRKRFSIQATRYRTPRKVAE